MKPETFLAWRRRAGLTQKQAALRLGVAKNTIQNWESGATRIPRFVEAGVGVPAQRLQQEDLALGPVILVYTERPMHLVPHAADRATVLMKQEVLLTNAAALGRVVELSATSTFNTPLILTETGEILWDSSELQRMVSGD